jgi:cytochrome P450
MAGRDLATCVSLPAAKTHLLDPPLEFDALRAAGGLCRLRYSDGSLGWLVTTHRLARMVLRDSRFGMGVRSTVRDAAGEAITRDGLTYLLEAFLLRLDPPVHARFRRLVAARFTVRHVQEREQTVRQIVAQQCDVMEQVGPPADIVELFALPVALGVHCMILGAPLRDAKLFAPISQPFFATADVDDVRELLGRLVEYLQDLIERKRAEPADDLISDIVAQEDLTTEQVLSLAFNFMTGGRGSVEDMLNLSVLALLCHPEQMAILRSGAVSLDAATEEILRYVGNFAVTLSRQARVDVDVDGIRIKAGEHVTVSLASANRDSERFRDPDVLDLRRSAAGHVAFGYGVHACLGQHFARLALRVSLATLLERCPALRLGVPASEVRVYGTREGGTTYGVHELPVVW